MTTHLITEGSLPQIILLEDDIVHTRVGLAFTKPFPLAHIVSSLCAAVLTQNQWNSVLSSLRKAHANISGFLGYAWRNFVRERTFKLLNASSTGLCPELMLACSTPKQLRNDSVTHSQGLCVQAYHTFKSFGAFEISPGVLLNVCSSGSAGRNFGKCGGAGSPSSRNAGALCVKESKCKSSSGEPTHTNWFHNYTFGSLRVWRRRGNVCAKGTSNTSALWTTREKALPRLFNAHKTSLALTSVRPVW